MVQLSRCRKTPSVAEGKTWPHPAKAKVEREYRVYRWNPDDTQQSAHRHLLRRHRGDCGPMVLDALIWIKIQ
jgi:succinate dehydrogenase / fumarate reductase iron-sulfur subunit